jgi:3'-5' exoribonuclease
MKVRSTFVASETQIRSDSRGESYLYTKLTDRTGSVDALMWKLPREVVEELSGPQYVRVEGKTHEYRGTLQVKIEHLKVLPKESVSEEDYLPATEKDRLALAAEVERTGRNLDNPHLRELVELMISDKEFWEAFCTAPAAKSMHHARIGGLLEHSVQCLRIAHAIAGAYPVDRDLLFFGAIFHDAGKVRELSWDTSGFAYTTEGRLQGHVVLGDRLVASYIARLPDFPEALALQLSHVLLSHQGELEYGSPELPRTLEALLVHMIDNLDARAAMFVEITANVGGGGWSHHDNPLRRALYVPDGSNAEE